MQVHSMQTDSPLKSAESEPRTAPSPSGLADSIELVNGGADHVIHLRPRTDLFENGALLSMESRALSYLRSGLPIHLRGPAGTGKTTLAIQIAARLGRPTILITGDGWFTAQNLIGRETGTKSKQVVDHYIHSVKKVQTEVSAVWSDDALTRAVSQGFTLVYDEFTRSPPQANNPLLAAFEERMLIVPGGARRERVVHAHPNFRAILTSNPDDYAGVTIPQDALIDRMITFDLENHDRDTEIGIVANRSGLELARASRVVDLIRALRGSPFLKQSPSMRSAIMIARITVAEDLTVGAHDPRFLQLCLDVLESKTSGVDQKVRGGFRTHLVDLVRSTCGAGLTESAA
jgi:gas vesicle protein GvpN